MNKGLLLQSYIVSPTRLTEDEVLKTDLWKDYKTLWKQSPVACVPTASLNTEIVELTNYYEYK